MKYRADIDGLRAVAVLPVVAFHAGFSQIPGGFVGVDVFFVISGYLISGIVLDEVREHRFSILNFYERRARRILPALFAMLAVTAVAVAVLMSPNEVVAFARSLLAAVFSVSNIWFWLQSGYFDEASHQMPLLHTWSLAVEEQFYLIMPALLLALRKLPATGLKLVMWAIALVSLAVSIWGVSHEPSSTFYLLHTRAWELALGALIAMDAFPAVRNVIARNLLSAGGLAAIGYALFFFNNKTPFPGAAALAPCLGAGAVILAGRSGETWAGRLLSLKPMVWVGLISYSLYLWHWPVIVLQNASLVLGDGLSPKVEKLVLVAASLLLGWLSWRFVERPFRKAEGGFSRKAIFIGSGVGAGLLSLAAVGLIATGGLPGRLPASADRMAAWLDYDQAAPYRMGQCFLAARVNTPFDKQTCLTPRPNTPTYLVFGDSHGAHLWYGLDKAMPDASVLQATSGGCRPIYPIQGSDPRCLEMMRYMFEDYLPTAKLDAVLVAGRWGEEDIPALMATLDRLKRQNVPVILLGPVIRYDKQLPRLLSLADIGKDPGLVARHKLPVVRKVDRQLARLAAEHGVRYISLLDLMCPDGQCVTLTPEGAPMQFDSGHLTAEGSVVLGRRIAAVLARPVGPTSAQKSPGG